MVFNICSDVFWEKTESLLSTDPLHVNEINTIPIELGLSYETTDYDPDSGLCIFRFNVVDKERFFLAKIKYGF